MSERHLVDGLKAAAIWVEGATEQSGAQENCLTIMRRSADHLDWTRERLERAVEALDWLVNRTENYREKGGGPGASLGLDQALDRARRTLQDIRDGEQG